MTLHIHKLDGCAPTPLAHYLKALAILRLVAEQRDASVRGWWKDEAFWLATELSREELLRFFLEEYAPTPILSPWNGGSGFYKNWDEKSGAFRNSIAVEAVELLRSSGAPRLQAMRAAISAYDEIIDTLLTPVDIEHLPKQERAALLLLARSETTRGIDKDEGKQSLLFKSGRIADEHGGTFVHAAVSFLSDATEWVPLWGRGGTDGKMEFPNNFLRRLIDVFEVTTGAARVGADALLRCALFDVVSSFEELQPGPLSASETSIGFFSPGCAGGPNMGAGYQSESSFNPWDFILMLEGALLFGASVTRQAVADERNAVSAPFAIFAEGIGHGSSAAADEKGSKFRKYEQWVPMWEGASLLTEVRSLLAEGRAALKRGRASTTEDFARAIARLGVARGVSSFGRYGYIERNGQANLAVPLGRWTVASQPHASLLDDVDSWLGSLRAFAHAERAPKAITSATRLVDEAVLAVCRAGGSPENWQALLIALGRAESALLRSPKTAGDPKRRLAPLPPLRIEWLSAANDGSPELRLAIALASQDVALRSKGGEVFASVRAHWMPLDRSRAATRPQGERRAAKFATDAGGVAHDPDVVCVRDDLEEDCVNLVRRRAQLAPTLRERSLGLFGARGAEAPLADVMAFLARDVNDTRILSLAKPLMAVSWWTDDRRRVEPPHGSAIDAVYAIVRIAHLSQPLDRGNKITIKLDPEAIARLSSGALAGALTVCNRRLRASGLLPVLRHAVGANGDARRLAASLAFPIRPVNAARCADLVTKPYEEGDLDHAD